MRLNTYMFKSFKGPDDIDIESFLNSNGVSLRRIYVLMARLCGDTL